MHLNNLSDEKSNRSTNPVIGKISQNMHLLVNVGILKIMKIIHNVDEAQMGSR